MYEACLLHSRSERVLKNLVAKNLEQWKITRMEWLMLATVARDPKNSEGHTMGELAELLDIKLSQVTALVNSMSHQNLLAQEVAEHDRRTRFVAISPAGEELLSKIEADMREAMRTWLSAIPRPQLVTYMQTVAQLGTEVHPS